MEKKGGAGRDILYFYRLSAQPSSFPLSLSFCCCSWKKNSWRKKGYIDGEAPLSFIAKMKISIQVVVGEEGVEGEQQERRRKGKCDRTQVEQEKKSSG